MAKNGTLTTKKRNAITALLTAPTVGEAAQVAGVGERTLHRWLHEDVVFSAAVREAETAAINEAARRLVGLQSAALDVLENVMADPMEKTTFKLRAAATVLQSLLQLRELHTVEERLRELERKIEQQNHATH